MFTEGFCGGISTLVCLSCRPSERKSNPRKIWSQAASDVDMYSAQIDGEHTYKPNVLSYASQPHSRDKHLQTIACARVGTSSEMSR